MTAWIFSLFLSTFISCGELSLPMESAHCNQQDDDGPDAECEQGPARKWRIVPIGYSLFFCQRSLAVGSCHSQWKVRTATSRMMMAQMPSVSKAPPGNGALFESAACRAWVSAAAGRICARAANPAGR